jgi:hypothetical protein
MFGENGIAREISESPDRYRVGYLSKGGVSVYYGVDRESWDGAFVAALEEHPEFQDQAELATAYHEAGHVVAAFFKAIPFSGKVAVSILPEEGSSGRFFHNWILANPEENDSDRERLKMERHVIVGLAGIEAQLRFDPESIRVDGLMDWDGSNDYHSAIELIDYFSGGNEETEAYLNLLRIRAKGLVGADSRWKRIKALAAELMKKKVLSAREARKIIREAGIPR